MMPGHQKYEDMYHSFRRNTGNGRTDKDRRTDLITKIISALWVLHADAQ